MNLVIAGLLLYVTGGIIGFFSGRHRKGVFAAGVIVAAGIYTMSAGGWFLLT